MRKVLTFLQSRQVAWPLTNTYKTILLPRTAY